MKSDFLYAQPSFVSGIASVVDIEGLNFYNDSNSTSEADKLALKSDWRIVGDDIRGAITQYEQEQR